MKIEEETFMTIETSKKDEMILDFGIILFDKIIENIKRKTLNDEIKIDNLKKIFNDEKNIKLMSCLHNMFLKILIRSGRDEDDHFYIHFHNGTVIESLIAKISHLSLNVINYIGNDDSVYRNYSNLKKEFYETGKLSDINTLHSNITTVINRNLKNIQ